MPEISRTPAKAKRLSWPAKHWRLLLACLLVVTILAAGVLFLRRHIYSLLFFRSHIVAGQSGIANLHLPPGFRMNVFYPGLASPRLMTFSPDGTLFIAERGNGNIIALPDPKHTGQATKKVVVVSGLNDPTSLSFYQGKLYVGEASQISRFTLDANLHVTDKRVVIPNLPTGGNHITRTVLAGPDGKLYVSVGSTCNVCVETDQRRATILQYNLDGSGGRVYARGLRNAVGLATNPWTHQIWVTNNGRDDLGDDIPPETVYALQDGGNYGWPRCQAGTIIDPEYGQAGDCDGVVQPLVKMQAHSAPLGLAFYNASQFPQRYHGLFVAFHGSWNRSAPAGYKVVFIPLDRTGKVTGPAEDFATGWLENADNTLGRPAGVAVGPDGALYISEDKGGVIYRITYTG